MVGKTHLPQHRSVSQQRRLIALLCVIALHIAFYGLLRGSASRQARSDARPARFVTLRVLPWLEAGPPQVQAEPKSRPQERHRASPAPITATVSANPGSARAATAATTADPSPVPALPASQPRPLDLSLRRGFAAQPGVRNPALDDGRTNTMRQTPEERMAQALDSRVIEESFGDGRRRIRQGSKCVIVKPLRAAQLFSYAPGAAPSLVEDCR